MIVKMFMPEFHALVESGQKRQTIRPTPKKVPQAGQEISLRAWTGKPYRSKQRVLRESVVTRIQKVEIFPSEIKIDGKSLDLEEEWQFAKADGFNTPKDLTDWFNATHGLPFEGTLYKWT